MIKKLKKKSKIKKEDRQNYDFEALSKAEDEYDKNGPIDEDYIKNVKFDNVEEI